MFQVKGSFTHLGLFQLEPKYCALVDSEGVFLQEKCTNKCHMGQLY